MSITMETKTLDQYLQDLTEDEMQRAISQAKAVFKTKSDKEIPEESQLDLSKDLDQGNDWIDRAEKIRSVDFFKVWASKYNVKIICEYTISSGSHKGGIAFCVPCPWEHEHSMSGPENESVVIVDVGGQLNFLCRHSHGRRYGWKQYKSKIESDNPNAVEVTNTSSLAETKNQGNDQKKLHFTLTKDGEIAKRLENYVVILQEDTYFSGKIRYNAFTNNITVEGFPWWLDAHTIQDVDMFNMRQMVSEGYGLSNKEDLRQAIAIVAFRNQFHPVRDLLNGLEWDGVSRISNLFPKYLGAERSDYTTIVTLILLHGVIQRVFNPGVKFDLVLILVDPKQGTGKSTICRFIALDDEWFTDQLGSLENLSKAYETISGHMIVELAEMLATKRAKDIEGIKAYVSRTTDIYRMPYSVYSQQIPRQCVFIGTSNRIQVLPDDISGNRRFLPLPCDGDKAEIHPLADEAETRSYILQCYAEAKHIGDTDGWQLTLPKEFQDEVEALRESSTSDDGKAGVIQRWLDSTDEDLVCTRMIFDKCFNNSSGDRVPTRFDLSDIADIMNFKVIGWSRYRGKNGNSSDNKARFDDYGIQRAWVRDKSVPSDCTGGNKTGNKTGNKFGFPDGFVPVEGSQGLPFD